LGFHQPWLLLPIELYPQPDPNQIEYQQLQWDPDGIFMASGWGQAKLQGGRHVRNLSYPYPYPGWLLGPQHGPGAEPALTLHIPWGKPDSEHPSWIRRKASAAFFSPTSALISESPSSCSL
jgi:hypothetical protein